jgi:hypothetical protein
MLFKNFALVLTLLSFAPFVVTGAKKKKKPKIIALQALFWS